MYREPALPEREAPAPDFLYAVVDREQQRHTALATIYLLVALPLVIGVLFALLVTPTLALAAILVTAALLWWWRRKPTGAGVLLRVEGDELCVLDARSKERKARLRLADLADVTLDTKTIHPMMEGSSPIAGLRFMSSQPLPDVDQKRIVLLGKSGPVPLTEAYLANVEVTEWFGKIRVFLRKHGWAPLSERERDAEPDPELL